MLTECSHSSVARSDGWIRTVQERAGTTHAPGVNTCSCTGLEEGVNCRSLRTLAMAEGEARDGLAEKGVPAGSGEKAAVAFLGNLRVSGESLGPPTCCA